MRFLRSRNLIRHLKRYSDVIRINLYNVRKAQMKQSQLYALYDSDPESVVDFLEYVRASYGLPEAPAVLDMGLWPGTSAGTPKPARVECDGLRTGL